MTTPNANIHVLIEELTLFLCDETKSGYYQVTKEDIHVLISYINYLKQIEQHVKASLASDIVSPYGFRNAG
jgi:hypothetical protein